MNIAFDASDICTGRADGTTRYTRELVTRLSALAKKDSWNFYGPCVAAVSFPRMRESTSQTLGSPIKSGMTNSAWHSSKHNMGWTQTRFAWDLFWNKPDVLFMPIQQLPILRRSKMKTVAVIHDLAFHEYGSQFRYKDWILLHTFSAQVAREADAIIAVSQATKDDIKKYYGRTKNVHVIHLGIDHDRFRIFSDAEKQTGLKKLQEKYPTLRKNYLLFVGQIQPRKNIERLVEAFEQLARQDGGPALRLVIAGGYGWNNKEIYERIEKSPARKNIILTGAVPDELLPTLYANAEAFILPSLQEGFGIPLIEASACGVPVVTSNCSSMKEIMDSAGVLVDPLSAQSIANGITEALTNKKNIAEKCTQRAKQFSWDKTAQKTLDIIKGVYLERAQRVERW